MLANFFIIQKKGVLREMSTLAGGSIKGFATTTSALTMDTLAMPFRLIIADYADACFLSKYKIDTMAMTSVAITKDSCGRENIRMMQLTIPSEGIKG